MQYRDYSFIHHLGPLMVYHYPNGVFIPDILGGPNTSSCPCVRLFQLELFQDMSHDTCDAIDSKFTGYRRQ